MDSIYSALLGALMGQMGRGEVIGRDTVGDYTIDTCYTIDQSWETAVWKKKNPVIIVGRYTTKEEAQEGHETWCQVCEQLKPYAAWSVQTDSYESFDGGVLGD